MTWRRRRARPRGALVLLLLLTPLGCAGAPPEPRDVTLVARGMAFELVGGDGTPNPVIIVRAGERIRVVLRNEAPGLLHDFRIPAWKVQTEQIRAGQTTEVVFTVPSTPGLVPYECHPHAELMKGSIEIRP